MSLLAWAVCLACALPLAGTAVLLAAFIVASIRWYRSGAHKRKLHSCLYEGRVRHARFHPTKHSFNYPIFFAYVDLDELPLLQNLWPLFGYNCPSVASLQLTDHLRHKNRGPGTKAQTAEVAAESETFQDKVRRSTQEICGYTPPGSIRLLTHLRYWGYCFNPVSFYYIMKPRQQAQERKADNKEQQLEEEVDAMIAEVTNTPWIEMHCYVLCKQNKGVQSEFDGEKKEWHYNFAKDFHVSPFMEMNHVYEWTFSPPGPRITAITNMRKGEDLFFSAKFNLTRTEITPLSWLRVMLFYPFQTWMVQLYIHYEALKLWVKSVPIYPHPEGTQTTASLMIWYAIRPFYLLHKYLSQSKQKGE